MIIAAYSAIFFIAVACVLDSRRKNIDLLGAILIAIAGSLGGGTIRDILLNRPVFWLTDETYLVVAVSAGIATFFIARRFAIPAGVFLYPDAVGLALFTATGVQVSIDTGAPWLAASLLGVITGAFGGVLRDILLNEIPIILISTGELYATAAWIGGLLQISLLVAGASDTASSISCMATVLCLRFAAMQWKIRLPGWDNLS